MQAVHDLQHVFPGFAFDVVGIGAEEIGGMIGGHDRNAAVFAPFAAEFGDAEAWHFAKEAVDRGGAERDDGFGFDEIDLRVEIGKAAFHFFGCGRAIAVILAGGVRAAFEDVRDVNLLAGEAHGLNDFGEELSGATDEGFGLLVFFRTGSFADEHEFGIDATDAEDDVFARGDEVGTFLANEGAFAELFESLEFGDVVGENDGGFGRPGCGPGGS